MIREGFAASAQKCNGGCLPLSLDTQFIHFYLGGQSTECLCNFLLEGSLKIHLLINLAPYVIGLMITNFHPNLISLSSSLFNTH